MATDITIKNLQTAIPIRHNQILKAAKEFLRAKRVEDAQLSLVFTSTSTIKQLNKKYLNRSYATDVLAFDLGDKKSSAKNFHGEIIICAQTAQRNSKIFRTRLADELLLYVAHGILHILGFDDHEPKDIKRMRREEQKLLKLISA
ncbi:MAG: rRNA maturation RNase YbeY [Candidatus Omnitrophota bacterium]